MELSYFPSYTEIADHIDEGVRVNLDSGKSFTYQVTTTGVPGRYRSLGARTELDAGGLVFAGVEPIRKGEQDVPGQDSNGDPVMNKEISYSIVVEDLEEVN